MILPVAKLLVPVPGTIVRATSQELDPAQHYSCHGILIQALPANIGRIYIGAVDMDRVNRTGLYAILAIPTVNSLPTFSAALTIAANSIALETLYIDADTAGDGVILSVLIA